MSATVITVDDEGQSVAPPIARRRGQRGQGMVEYAFILVMVAIVVLVSVMVLGKTTGNLYSNVSSGLNT
ncbi:MAG TPA: Flp family type IVb pilin [Candidatus Dormibacteraeota bacterium]|jgi:Flp pilus assembly pilin Flp